MSRFEIACHWLITWLEIYSHAIDVYCARKCDNREGVRYWSEQQTKAEDRLSALEWDWRFNV